MCHTSRVFGERLEVLAPASAPEISRDGSSPQLYGLHLYAARTETVHLRYRSRSLLIDGYVTWVPVHFQILQFLSATP